MKDKKLIIKEIEETIDNYNEFSIGLRGHPQSTAILQANDKEVIYAENCTSENAAKEVVNYFQEKGLGIDNRFSQNIAKGVFVIKKNN